MTCIGLAPGVQFCGYLPGAPGSTTTVTTCWSDGDCRDWPMVVADCSAGGVTVFSTCGEAGPVAEIHFDPAVAELSSVSTFGVPLDCTGMAPGVMICGPLPGEAGSPTTVTTCFEGEACTDWPLTIAACEEDVPPEGAWTLLDVGCHDETRIYVLVDTGLEWLLPGAAFTYSAWDEQGYYTCSVHPTVPGRLYCSGDRRGDPDTFHLCIQPDGVGASEICNAFGDFTARVAALPPCGTEDVPPDEPSVDPCSVFTNLLTCEARQDQCHWANGACVSNP
jgi:hypothetical protein